MHTLRTPRLTLRPFTLDDVDAVQARATNPDFTRYVPIPQPYARRDAETFVASVLLRSWDTHPTFAAEADGQNIGDVNLRIDPTHATASLGYGIDPEHWGNGYATEMAGAVIRWAFDDLGLRRVEATADAENVASWRVMEKLGMQREGLLRSTRVLRTEPRDIVLYAILATDLPSRPAAP